MARCDLKHLWTLAACAAFISAPAVAQVSVDVSGYGVKIKSDSGAPVNINTGQIGSDVQIEGVTIINDDVFIDGEKVPRGKTVYTSRKSKKTYLIQWGKNGNISVSEK